MALKDRGKEGYIDKHGTVVIPLRFDYVEDFSEGLALVSEAETLCFIDKRGEVIIRPKDGYEIFPLAKFKNGLAMVLKNDKCGFINKKGEVVIRVQFDFAEDFRDGLAAVCTGTTCGYVDPSGRYVWRAEPSRLIVRRPTSSSEPSDRKN